MGAKTKPFVRSLRNNGLKLFLDVQDVSDTVSEDGLSSGTKNAVKQLNASAVRHSLHTCHVTYTGVQGQEKGSLAPSSRLAESCTFVCQQPNHKNSNTASLEIFMAQSIYSKQQEQGWRALYRENSLRPVYHTKEKQGKYSQSIIPTGILCCQTKQYSHLRHVRYFWCEMANEWSDHSLLSLQPGNCRTP